MKNRILPIVLLVLSLVVFAGCNKANEDGKAAETPETTETSDSSLATNTIETVNGPQDVSFYIYGYDDCPFCVELKEYLDGKGIKYTEEDIRENEEKQAELFNGIYTELEDGQEYDRVYYPTTIISTEIDGEIKEKGAVGFYTELYDEIFSKIEDGTYFQ